MTDHPRIRGEHVAVVLVATLLVGSSPHTRGARHVLLRLDRVGRIIPAYAGSTPRPPTPPPSRTDHPRIRGEHGVAQAGADLLDGSSPHTRGARDRNQGKPLSSPDHPRIRGEHCSRSGTGRPG